MHARFHTHMQTNVPKFWHLCPIPAGVGIVFAAIVFQHDKNFRFFSAVDEDTQQLANVARVLGSDGLLAYADKYQLKKVGL